ncbi:MAG: hypothetical protein AB7O97_18100 [Planctomycetota bacterium]
MRRSWSASALLALAAAAPAQAECTLSALGPGVLRVTGDARYAGEGHAQHAALPAGAWQLWFAPVDGGRPEPVAVAAPAGGLVSVRVAAPPAGARVAAPRLLAAELDEARTFPAAGGVRVRALVTPGSGAAGLVARWRDADTHYRLVLDPAAAQLRLERVLGGSALVLGSAALPDAGGGAAGAAAPRVLELEADGFRLRGSCDERPLLHVLDGGLEDGAVGTWLGDGGNARFAALSAAAPAPALPVTAAAVDPTARTARVLVQAAAFADCPFALCLRLDRPTAAWPTDPRGFEVFVLQAPAEPVLPVFAVGRFDRDGRAEGELRWPAGASLQLQAALVGGFVGTADGEALRARAPFARVTF